MVGMPSAPKKSCHEKSDKCPNSGFIGFEVDRVSTLNSKGRLSSEVYIGGLPWRGLVRKEKWEGGDYLQVQLCSLDISSKQWSIGVKADFALINSDSSHNIVISKSETFNSSLKMWGARFVWNDLIDNDMRFIKDDKIVVEIRFSIVNMKGIWIQPRFDASQSDGKESVIGVMMEGKLVAVEKQSLFSSVIASTGSDIDRDDDSTGFIRWEIRAARISPIIIHSAVTEVHGMKWKITARKFPMLPHLEMCIESPKSDSNIWSINVNGRLTLVSNIVGGTPKIKRFNTTFNRERTNLSYAKFIRWDDMINEEKGFVKDGKITIELQFNLSNIVGIRTFPRFDFADPNDPRHDVALMIEGEKVYVGRQILAFHSPVFNAMFFGRFVERNKKEIELNDIIRKEFIEMLNLIYPSHQKINETSVESLLRIADRFEIKMVTDKVEQYLIDSNKWDILGKLNISDMYRLVKLQDHCLASFTTVDDVMELQNQAGYKDLSAFAKSALLDKAMKLR